MDNSFVELDSFTEAMVRRTRQRQQALEGLQSTGENEEGEYQPRSSKWAKMNDNQDEENVSVGEKAFGGTKIDKMKNVLDEDAIEFIDSPSCGISSSQSPVKPTPSSRQNRFVKLSQNVSNWQNDDDDVFLEEKQQEEVKELKENMTPALREMDKKEKPVEDVTSKETARITTPLSKASTLEITERSVDKESRRNRFNRLAQEINDWQDERSDTKKMILTKEQKAQASKNEAIAKKFRFISQKSTDSINPFRAVTNSPSNSPSTVVKKFDQPQSPSIVVKKIDQPQVTQQSVIPKTSFLPKNVVQNVVQSVVPNVPKAPPQISQVTIKKDVVKETTTITSKNKVEKFESPVPMKRSENVPTPIDSIIEKFEKKDSFKPVGKHQIAHRVAVMQEKLFGGPTATTSCSNLVAKQVESRKKEINQIRESFKEDEQSACSYSKEVENRRRELDALRSVRSKNTNGKTNLPAAPIEMSEATEPSVEKKKDDVQLPTQPVQPKVGYIDDETAQSTVSDAFREIEDYNTDNSSVKSSSISTSSSSTSITYQPNNENKASISPIKKVQFESNLEASKAEISQSRQSESNLYEQMSPSKKNKLYPDLPVEEENVNEVKPSISPIKKAISPVKKMMMSQAEGFDNQGLYDVPSASKTTPMRTISFYRREQMIKIHNTPNANTIVIDTLPSNSCQDEQILNMEKRIRAKIHELSNDKENQLDIINQTRKALLLCSEKNEFRNSTQQIEAEKHLLIAKIRHEACLNELRRLKGVIANKAHLDCETSRGTMTITNMQLPFKREFISSEKIFLEQHHILCLIHSNGKVIATSMLKSPEDIKHGKMDFFNHIILDDLENNFNVMVEVYDLTIARDHTRDMKHHLGSKTLKALTPKKKDKLKKGQSPSLRGSPAIGANMNAQDLSGFVLCGRVNIRMNNYKKESFRMIEESENFSQLAGVLNCKINLNAEHYFNEEGFLNISDDMLLSWCSRWCSLKGYVLSLWRFPDDVSTKPPMSTIDLRECINPLPITNVPIEVCVRRNTFALVTRKEGNGKIGYAVEKHFISTDSKEECIEWKEKFTKVLSHIRAWNTNLYACMEKDCYDATLLH